VNQPPHEYHGKKLKIHLNCFKSISTGAQYVTLDNKIKCLSLAGFYFGNPTNKTVTGTAYTWELLIANHLDQSLWSTNQKYWAAVRSTTVLRFLPATASFTNLVQKKPISWDKPAHYDFFTINFTVCSQILSTVGYALSYINIPLLEQTWYLRSHLTFLGFNLATYRPYSRRWMRLSWM